MKTERVTREGERRRAGGSDGVTVLCGGRVGRAFSLIEVMIAATIFFVAMFSILALLSSGLHAAAMLRNNGPTAGMAVASLTLTNQLEECSESGEFGEAYPDYTWQRNVREVATNGLFQVDVAVYHKGEFYSSMNILLFRTESVHH